MKHMGRTFVRLTAILVTFLISIEASESNMTLAGVGLRCCTLIEPPITFQNKDRKPHGFDGLAIEYLQLLQEQLGFTCDSHRLYRKPNETGTLFTSFVRDMHKCTTGEGTIRSSLECTCDIGVGGWSLNQERIGLVDFLTPFAMDTFEVLVNAEDTYSSSGCAFFLTAFSWTVWGSVSALFFLFTFLKLLDKRFVPPDQSFDPLPVTEPRAKRLRHFLLKSRIPYRLRKAIQSALSRMVGQGNSDPVDDVPSTRHWILNFTIALCSLFLVLAYESSMTASLVQENGQSDYQSVHDFKSCKIRASDVCVAKGGAEEAFWHNSISYGTCHETEGAQGPIFFDTYDEEFQILAKKECRFLLTTGSIARDVANGGKYRRKFMVTGEQVHSIGLSFILPLGSNLTCPMSHSTLDLRATGLIPTTTHYVTRRGSSLSAGTTTLDFAKLRMFFILAYSACFLIFLEMIFDPQTALRASSVEEERVEDGKA